ncbi:MAG: 50S ribosomal protein L5 [Gammaproteobacteria bacterium]
MSALYEHYKKELRPQLMQALKLDNLLQVPALTKVTLNMGVGDAARSRDALQATAEELGLIAGQKAIICKARRSVASFKIRTGMPLGCKVTLRRSQMYHFIERLIHIALPRERDFQGLKPSSMDGSGNFSMGIKEHIIFPEIDYDKVVQIRGLDVCITTSASNDAQGLALLRILGMPFRS